MSLALKDQKSFNPLWAFIVKMSLERPKAFRPIMGIFNEVTLETAAASVFIQ